MSDTLDSNMITVPSFHYIQILNLWIAEDILIRVFQFIMLL